MVFVVGGGSSSSSGGGGGGGVRWGGGVLPVLTNYSLLSSLFRASKTLPQNWRKTRLGAKTHQKKNTQKRSLKSGRINRRKLR